MTPSAAAVAQVAGARAGVVLGLAPLDPGSAVAGPAVTCGCAPADNLALHRALVAAPPRSVLVCAAGGSLDAAYFGELMATDALRRGVAGLVLHGAARDAEAVVRLGFPVFCAGTNPRQATKERALSVGEPVDLAGVRVAPGDMVVADRDGVVVVPAAAWPEVAAAAEALERREREVAARLAAGEALADLIALPPA